MYHYSKYSGKERVNCTQQHTIVYKCIVMVSVLNRLNQFEWHRGPYLEVTFKGLEQNTERAHLESKSHLPEGMSHVVLDRDFAEEIQSPPHMDNTMGIFPIEDFTNFCSRHGVLAYNVEEKGAPQQCGNTCNIKILSIYTIWEFDFTCI
jgi:hypothetical protein